jgi:hypothetical protein
MSAMTASARLRSAALLSSARCAPFKPSERDYPTAGRLFLILINYGSKYRR